MGTRQREPPQRDQNRQREPPQIGNESHPFKNLSRIKNLTRGPRAACAGCKPSAPRKATQQKRKPRPSTRRFGLKAAGADFGKPASGLQGQQAKRVAEPPSKPHWRPLRHVGQTLEKNYWTAETERLGGAGLFQTHVTNAVPQLPRRKEIAKVTYPHSGPHYFSLERRPADRQQGRKLTEDETGRVFAMAESWAERCVERLALNPRRTPCGP